MTDGGYEFGRLPLASIRTDIIPATVSPANSSAPTRASAGRVVHAPTEPTTLHPTPHSRIPATKASASGFGSRST